MFSITTKMMCLVNGKMRMDPKEFHMAPMPNIFFFANVFTKKNTWHLRHSAAGSRKHHYQLWMLLMTVYERGYHSKQNPRIPTFTDSRLVPVSSMQQGVVPTVSGGSVGKGPPTPTCTKTKDGDQLFPHWSSCRPLLV